MIEKKIWFQGGIHIACSIKDIKSSLNNLGEHYQKIINKYPGMVEVELLDQGEDYVIIRTNEGEMKRENISVSMDNNKIIIELNETYTTTKTITKSHIVEEITTEGEGVQYNLQINNLKAPGFLGFLLRNFGAKSIGRGFLDAYEKNFEKK